MYTSRSMKEDRKWVRTHDAIPQNNTKQCRHAVWLQAGHMSSRFNEKSKSKLNIFVCFYTPYKHQSIAFLVTENELYVMMKKKQKAFQGNLQGQTKYKLPAGVESIAFSSSESKSSFKMVFKKRNKHLIS